MHTAKNESLRRAMYLKFNTRAFPDNEEVLLQILRHRWDKARLLGYADFAELATSGNMVRNASRVQHYLNTIGALLEDAVDSEMMMLNSSTATHGVNVFKPYNYAYGHALYSNLSFALNSTEVASYFTTHLTLQGVLSVASQMYNISFTQNTAVPTWYSDVLAYDIYDKNQSNKLIGRAYLDLYPRTAKFKHAAMFPIRRGMADMQIPEAALVCNFPKAPAQMSFGDAVTFFHEFGHLLHHVLGGQDQQYIGFSGIATAWDFVEAPSQMFEHWPHSAATLQSFTRTVVACGVSCADWCGCSSVPHRRRWLTSWKHQGLSRSGS
eukprot:m.199959 g.199959  ORF g.199959 m.199959 type:complete len:323 (+) comp18778_c0_seq53:1853-2821(+)